MPVATLHPGEHLAEELKALEAGDIIVAQGKYSVSISGGKPTAGVPWVSRDFEVNGRITLPE